MNKKSLLALIPLMSIALTSCGAVQDYKQILDEYVATMKFHEDFNILQLTDIHWNANSSVPASRQYMDKLIAQVDAHIKATQGANAKIDLVELTGDQFMLANSFHVDSFVKFFEEKANQYGFMYTAIWGNHDRHGLYNPNWLSDQFRKAEHCIYIEPMDNLYGRSNFVINLTEDGAKASKTIWQIANLDSGASFSETAVSPFRDYDYIRDDQVDWWVQENNAVNNAPTIAYYHIPQDDNNKAYEARSGLKNKFFKLEGFADNGEERYASKFVKEGRKLHSLKGAFMGHAHNVDWTVEDDGVVIGLGVKTGPELYYAHIDPNDSDPLIQEGFSTFTDEEKARLNQKFDLIGASLVTVKDYVLKEEASFELEHVYFNERATGDFVEWVKW